MCGSFDTRAWQGSGGVRQHPAGGWAYVWWSPVTEQLTRRARGVGANLAASSEIPVLRMLTYGCLHRSGRGR